MSCEVTAPIFLLVKYEGNCQICGRCTKLNRSLECTVTIVPAWSTAGFAVNHGGGAAGMPACTNSSAAMEYQLTSIWRWV